MTLPDSDDLNSVGGEISDYRPVPDPTVEREAANESKIAANAVMATRTAIRAWVKFTGHATTPTASSWDAVWKGATPTTPVVAKGGTGIYTITFPATVDDELGVEHTVNLRAAWAQLGGSTLGLLLCEVTAPNVITVRAWTGVPALNDFVGTGFAVFAV